MKRRIRRTFVFLAVHLAVFGNHFLCAAQQPPLARNKNGDEELFQTSGRLVNELFEIFAHSPQTSSNSDIRNSNRIITKSFQQNDAEVRRFPSSSDPESNSDPEERSKAWSELAREVFKIFRSDLPTTTPIPTTTTPASFAKKLKQLVPGFLNPFSENNDISTSTALPPFTSSFTFATLPTIPPFILTTKKPPAKKEDTIFSRISSLFSGDDEHSSDSPNGPQIDTGRNFERFVVREMADADNPISSLLGGKFKERGVEWNNGNLRFVNKQGSKLLGTDLAVHDRSVDIPVDRWLGLASELVNAGSRNRK